MGHATANSGIAPRLMRRLPFLIAIMAGLMATLAIGATTAKAAPVDFKFDRGVINLGGEGGTWAKLIDPDLVPPDSPAVLETDVAAGGALTAAAEDFTFPPKRIEDLATGNSLLPFVDANILVTAEGPITGNYNVADGSGSVVIPADVLVTVYSAGSPASIARCRVDGFNFNLATTGNLSDPGDPAAEPPRPAAEYDAAPFAPPSGNGAMIATWAGLPAAQNEGGSLGSVVCPALDGLIGGPGGTWLSGAVGDFVPPPQPPTAAPRITGTPSSSTDSTGASFTYEAGETETATVTGFQCKLDAGAFEACDSGTKAYSGLGTGAHNFQVKSTNADGQGPVAPYNWTVTAVEVCPPGTTGTPPNCVKPPPEKAMLGPLKVTPKNKAVKRGKKATFTAKIKNTGNAVARNVKICVTAPKKFVKVKRCLKVGNLAAKKTATRKFKVTVKKKARKGKKLTLKFKASSNNAGAKSAKATIRVK